MNTGTQSIRSAPIGILDSGLGGLTIWKELHALLPHEAMIYIGDHAYQPYGKRSSSEIRARVRKLIAFLLQKGSKLIVIACNTATVSGIMQYRRWFRNIPIIGVVPVVKTAVRLTRARHFVVLSTPNTAASPYQKKLIKAFAAGCTVENIGIPELASMIEQGQSGSVIEQTLRRYLDPKRLGKSDVIVLGCTHYPLIRKSIARVVGTGTIIIDSGAAVARHAARVLDQERLRAASGAGYTEFYTTGNAPHVSRIAEALLRRRIVFTYAGL